MMDTPPVCDYEGSDYRDRFWESKPRSYEDRTEHLALRRLLPPRGRRVVHLGAGFGRMTHELDGYDQVIVLDYSRTMLRDAQARLGRDGRYVYVAADIYRLPLADGSCDAAVMERVIHHMADVCAALRQVRAVLAPGAPFVLEYASKRHLKSTLRYLVRRQDWNPFEREPVAFDALYFNFHPDYMAACLRECGFVTRRKLAVSYFRVGVLKRLIPLSVLVTLDRLMQPTGQIALYSPSVFTLNFATGSTPPAAPDGPLFKCPLCGAHLYEEGDELICPTGDGRWAVRDGIYDFKENLAAEGGKAAAQ
ncbi:MAG: methyltransferase domain-containing protein [Anaerolineae bacterium]|nr:methyltransferase domain-containing protein [Anaerolineae bacterium]